MSQAHLFFILAFIVYFVCFVSHIVAFFQNRFSWQKGIATGVWIGFVLHLIGIVFVACSSPHFPLSHTSEAYAFLSFLIVLFHLLFSLKYSVSVLSFFTLPLVQFLMLAAHLAGEKRELLPGYWLTLHVVLVFIAYGAFALAFINSAGYLLQDRQLKSHHTGKIFKWMPSLQVLDEVNVRSLVFGFILLSLGLLSGFLWAKTTQNQFWMADPKFAWSGLIWLLYAAVISLQAFSFLRGRKVAYGSVFGFILVIVSCFVVGHTVIK